MVRGKQVRRALARAGAALAMLATAATLAGCEPATPLVLNSYVDATFSNHRVAGACVGEVMRGAEAAARSQGSFSLHTFDGDPLERSGIVRQFSEDDVPRSIRGTAKVDEFLTSEAE